MGRLIYGWLLPLFLSVLMAAYWIGQTIPAQRFAGHMRPVVTLMHVESVKATVMDGLPSVVLSGTAEKLRDCTYRAIEWSLGGPYGVPVNAKFMDSPQVNGVGSLRWEALIVGITADRLFETYGEVIHSCWGVTVRTPFYIGQGVAG